MLLWMVTLLFVSCVGTNVWLNLRVLPNPVFEGDTLTLECRAGKHTAASQVKFYKDGQFLTFSKINQPLSIGAATLKSSGQYHCTGDLTILTYRFTQTSEATTVQVQELFQIPVLSTDPSPALREGSPLTLRCQTELSPQKSALRLLFSFYKDGHTMQNTSHDPELCLPGVKEGDSGLYWCKATLEGGQVQKESHSLEIRVQAPVSRPFLTLQHGATGPAVGDVIELLCEAQRGSPPVLYLFYLDEEILGKRSVLHGGAASLLFPVKSEQDAGNYSCEARNSVSREKSEPKKLSLDGPPPAPNPPPAPSGEQRPLYGSVRPQEENDEDITYSVVQTISKKDQASPAGFASEEKDLFAVYAEVRCPQLGERAPKDLDLRSKTSQDPLGACKDVLH